MDSDCKQINSLYCIMFGMKSTIVFMCAGQQVEHILNLHRGPSSCSETCSTPEKTWPSNEGKVNGLGPEPAVGKDNMTTEITESCV